MKRNLSPIITLKKHPFFVGVVNADIQNNIPKTIDFKLGVDQKLSIPRQLLNNEILSALKNAYNMGSMISTPLGESHLSTQRMNGFIDVILNCLKNKIRGKNFLEIGCGNGCLLNEINKKGGIVTGLEIGPQAINAKEKYGLEIINKSIEEYQTESKYDCIFSYGCLEHIIDLERFFELCRKLLKKKGLFLHQVPNIDISINNGLIDQLQHEHINYFNPENALPLIQNQGFINSGYQLSKEGNEMAIWGYYDDQKKLGWPTYRYIEEKNKIESFSKSIDQSTKVITETINKIIKNRKTIGFYAGGFEYSSMLNKKDIRYFDGDDFKVGKSWIIKEPLIEPISNLIKEPVDYIIVFKTHYFKAIKKKLIELGVNDNSIIDIGEIEILQKEF
ncbi:methyltransferase domain-containing protein [Acinetobacter sp.]|uniref:class I SAM-dependent methyltransferase n=1 Tax=Acinetobacter sp. TaxID=472 RepID=UPI000C3CF632|nr:methyltransferase domain-containing protein [Acinetobacter sp.]MBC69484.1 hypothetical protein [Acinetobacter sp.]